MTKAAKECKKPGWCNDGVYCCDDENFCNDRHEVTTDTECPDHQEHKKSDLSSGAITNRTYSLKFILFKYLNAKLLPDLGMEGKSVLKTLPC